MRSEIIDRFINKLDKLETEEIQSLILRAFDKKDVLEKVFDVIREGIIVSDSAGSIHYINGKASEFFGIQKNEALYKFIFELLPDIPWNQISSSKDVISKNIVIDYPEKRFLNVYIAPLDEYKEKRKESFSGFVFIIRDSTDSREKQIKQIESEKIKAIESLAAGVAHEIGNPLNSLNLHLQVIDKKIRNNLKSNISSDIISSLEIVRKEIKRLDQIIDSFLKTTRRSKLNLKEINLNTLLNETIFIVKAEIIDRNINIKLKLSKFLPKVLVDPDKIKQVIYNIIRNSIQALNSSYKKNDTGSKITIETGSNDNYVFIKFKDNGPGVSADKVSKVFEPYYTTKKDGSGLGFMIVNKIIHAHNGEIQFSSKDGKGTQVIIFLPLKEKRIRFLPGEKYTPIIDLDAIE